MVTAKRRARDPGHPKPKRRKTDNESTPTRFSRSCRICLTEVPRYLAVLNPCGHAVCHACALKLRFDASQNGRIISCSMCRSEGEFVELKEELIGESVEPHREREADEDVSRVFADADMNRVLADAAKAHDAHAEAKTRGQDMIDVLKLTAGILVMLLAEKAIAEMAKLARQQPEFASDSIREFTRMSDEAFAAHQAQLADKVSKAEDQRKRVMELSRVARQVMDDAERKYREQKARVAQLIDQFKHENEDSAARGLRISRACRACSIESPPLRSFFPICGHAVCRECADKTTASEADTQCPTCHMTGESIHLFEELAES